MVLLGAGAGEVHPHVRIPRAEQLSPEVIHRIIEALLRSARPSRVLLSLGRGVEVETVLPLVGRLHRLSRDLGFLLLRVPDPLATAKAILLLRPVAPPLAPVTRRQPVPRIRHHSTL
ncbi:hypothetical protein HY631_04610 [Candidatus Uhrbacteria bacterium]|nr:hypothetical protein [Candidatus Uhrbacteria bacterium]